MCTVDCSRTVQPQVEWGEQLRLPEWDDQDGFRSENGWKGRDLVHDKNSPVYISDYFVRYGAGDGLHGFTSGGIETRLTGIVHFTERAESHKGFCHGGSMCSVFDDVIGWCAFLVTGTCRPWSGYTVQVNTTLKKPIPINTSLVVEAEVVNVERRKVYIDTKLFDPTDDSLHAKGHGLVVLNRGELPYLAMESTESLEAC